MSTRPNITGKRPSTINRAITEKAAHHAHIAHGDAPHATDHAEEVVKHHADQHGIAHAA